MLSEERLRSVKTSLLSNHPNAGANHFVRGAHHRRCAREGLTAAYDASGKGLVASSTVHVVAASGTS